MKKIIFDFDGTLVNTNEAVIESLKSTYSHYKGTEADYQKDIEPILGKPLETQIGSFYIEKLDEAMDYYKNSYRNIRDEKTFKYEGVDQLLKTLKEKNYPMGILSNKGPSGLDHGLNKFDYNDYFQIIVSKDDVSKKKPHPDCFNPILKTMGGEIYDYIIVGDSTSDINLGHNLGIPSVLVSWTLLPEKVFSKNPPSYIIKTPMDLIKVLEELENIWLKTFIML